MHDEARRFCRASLIDLRPGWESSNVTAVVSARPATAARSFTAFPSGDACFLARKFVRRSLLVRGTTTLGGDCALGLGIHCRESARRFPAYRSAIIASYITSTFIDAIIPCSARFADASATAR
jgi:hypothetical protein